jgi:hypothetical protein
MLALVVAACFVDIHGEGGGGGGAGSGGCSDGGKGC